MTDVRIADAADLELFRSTANERWLSERAPWYQAGLIARQDYGKQRLNRLERFALSTTI